MTTGDEVVCIDGSFPAAVRKLYTALPVQDNIYTIRAVYAGRRIAHPLAGQDGGFEIGVLLVGLVNPPDPKQREGQELGFNSERFRLLNEQTADESRPETEHDGELVYVGKPGQDQN